MEKVQMASIDFGTSKIVTLLTQNQGSEKLNFLGVGTVPYDGYMNGDWNVPGQMVQAVSDSIAAAEYEAKRKIREVYVGVPCDYIKVRTTEAEIPLHGRELEWDDFDRVMDVAADQLGIAGMDCMVLHRSCAWARLDDGEKTLEISGKGQKLSACVSFVLASKDFIEDIKEILGALNITILGFLSTTLGTALKFLDLEERDRGAMIIDVGYLNTEISVVRGDALVYHCVLPQGGSQFMVELVDNLQIPMKAAERIKQNFNFKPESFEDREFTEVTDNAGRKLTLQSAQIRQCMNVVMDDLSYEIERVLSTNAWEYLGSRSKIYLTGGGLFMKGARQALSEKLKYGVQTFVTRTSSLNSPIYSSSLGLADYVMKTIAGDEQEQNDETLGDRVKDFLNIKNWVKRGKAEDEQAEEENE